MKSRKHRKDIRPEFAELLSEIRGIIDETRNKEIVASLSRQLSWSHFLVLIPLETSIKRNFYTEMCRTEGWSTRTLRNKIDSMLFERTAISKKPDEVARAELNNLRLKDRMSPDMVFKDPYFLDFLGLNDRYLEKDLEDSILREMEHNLRWLNKYERRPNEGSPLGIILCADKKREQIELLELGESGIHIAEYLTELPDEKLLREKLNNVIQTSRRRFENKEGNKE